MASSTAARSNGNPARQVGPARPGGRRYLFFLVAWPTSLIVRETFAHGMQGITEALDDPDVVHALQLTAEVAASPS